MISKNFSLRLNGNFWVELLSRVTTVVTLWKSRRIFLVDLKLEGVKNSGFLSILHTETKVQKSKSGVRVLSSKYDLPFQKSYESQFTQFSIFFAIAAKEPPTYTKKMIRMRFCEANSIKRFE